MLWQMPVVAVAVVLMMALLGLAASAIPVLRGLAVEPSKLLPAASLTRITASCEWLLVSG
jgi:hypothetical protein